MSQHASEPRDQVDGVGFPRPDELLSARFFAVPAEAARDRRPTDITMFVVASFALTVFAFRASSPPGPFEESFAQLVDRLPNVFDPLWRILHDALALWAVVVIVVAIARRQWGLVRDLIALVAVVLSAAAVVGRLSGESWPDLVDSLLGIDGLVDFPASGLALWVGITSVASSHLSRPYRYLGRWLIILGGFAAVALGATTPGGAFGATSLGLAAAAGVHLIFGSPGGLPSLTQVRAALAGIGVNAEPIQLSRRSGVVHARARDANGQELRAKIYGRDAWDGQLVVLAWRFVWYREQGPTLALTRLQQVEHEAFLTLLAERRGAMVTPVVAAGADSIGDALLVVQRNGATLGELPADVLANNDSPDAMWRSLALLHEAGLSHGAIDADRVLFDNGDVRLADLGSSLVGRSPHAMLVDRAQLLVTIATYFGIERAASSALTALGADGLIEVSSFIQPAALSGESRRQVAAAGLDVDDVRAAVVAAAGGKPRELQRLRRLSLGRVLTGLLLFYATLTLITGLLEIGIDTIGESLRTANLAIVIFAFFVFMLSRPINAMGLAALAPVKVPFGRLTMLQFAMSFINLAMPSTAGRVAANIRFFQRNGVAPTTAVAVGAIDGFSGFISQIILISSILLFGLGSLDFQIDDTFSIDSMARLLGFLALAAVAAIAVVAFVPALRRIVRQAFETLQTFVVPFLRSPARVSRTLGANMLSELTSALTIYMVLMAFDQSVGLADVILVSIAVSLFAGLMPVPGGIGVTEAALTAGFIAIGVPDATAFAAALTCRVVNYYVPPIPGWFALRWMQRRLYL